jgi:hypothetical protein
VKAFDGARLHVRPTRWGIGLAGVLLVAFGLRVWGISHGLPLIYNTDEQVHFVPKAIEFFESGYNPHYYFNPPGLTYLLHLVFAVRFGGEDGVLDAWATRSSDVFLVARYTSAILGTLAVFFVYLIGTRLFDRLHGLFASALLAVAFLPVFFSHQAVNDAPQLAPIALSLFGSAGILTRGRRLDYIVAGIGLGLACGTKYPAGIIIVPLLVATVARLSEQSSRRQALIGLLLAGAASIAAFLLCVPGVVFDTNGVLDDLGMLSVTPEGERKLGQSEQSGIIYYLWTLTWGLGWVPLIAALFGLIELVRTNRRLALFLGLAPVLFVIFMGIQERYFGRYLLPIFPLVCVLGAFGVLRVSRLLSERVPRLASAFPALAAIALLVEGLVHSIHTDLVLARKDTRELAREWMVENIPAGTLIVREPIMPPEWNADPSLDLARRVWGVPVDERWRELRVIPALKRLVNRGEISVEEFPDGRLPDRIGAASRVTYVRPELIDEFVRSGACWVVTGSSQWGRAFAEPEKARRAVAYYRALARRADVAYSSLPYENAHDPGSFNFDWSSNFYPLEYVRPGPEVVVYRLSGGQCGSGQRSD